MLYLFIGFLGSKKCLTKGPFTNTCKGGLMQTKFSAKNFQGPPFGPTKFFGAPFLTRKIGVNPIKNHIDSLFRGKISVVFFSGPPFRAPKFSGPPFLHQAPLTSVCERSLKSIGCFQGLYNVHIYTLLLRCKI